MRPSIVPPAYAAPDGRQETENTSASLVAPEGWQSGRMRRSRKPFRAVSSDEGSNPSPSAPLAGLRFAPRETGGWSYAARGQNLQSLPVARRRLGTVTVPRLSRTSDGEGYMAVPPRRERGRTE